MRKVYLLLALLAFALPFSTIANANVLAPGGAGLPDVLTFGGTLLASTSGTFTGQNILLQTVFTGSYEAAVISDPGNTFCAGCLDFVYIFANDATSKDAIQRSTTGSYTGFLTDVGYSTQPPAGTVAPTFVDRLTADTVGFSFLTGVTPGNKTVVLEIETNAKSFTAGAINFQDDGIATVSGFAPIPEPASLALLGAGLVGLGGLVRRKIAG